MAKQPNEERVVEIIVNGTKANASLKEMAAAAAVLSNQVAKIATDDPKRGELIAQLQQMRQRITDTRAEVNGLVQSQEQLAAAQAATVAEQARAIAAGKASTASLSEMKTAAGLLEKQLHEMAADDPGRAALIADFQQLKARMGEARAEMDRVVKSEAELQAEEEALHQAQAEQLAAQQRTIAAGKQSSASFVEMRAAAGLLEKQLHELSADDPGRAALIADYQALQARMGEARGEMTRVVKTEAELRAEQDALRASQVQLVVNGQKVSASMREMREAAAQLESELEELAQDDPARGPLIAALQQLRARIHDVQQEVAGVTQTTSRMRQVMTIAFGTLVGGGIEQGIEKVGELGKSIFDTTAKFETYDKVLSNAMGSESLGRKALADIQKMAAETPISVDTLTSSFIKFINRGLNPSMADLRKLGDLASSQGKDFDQLTEAVLDAGTGEFERLKEFGISASKSGDQVTLSFKGVNQTVANTPAAIQGAILAMGEAKGVVNGMAMIADGLEGKLSNLGDTADQTAVEWGQTLRPAFVAVLATLGFLLGMLKAVPSLVRENKGVILALAGALVVLNAEQVTWNLMLLQEAVQTKAGLVWKAASATATNVMTFSWKGLNAAMRANPIGFVIGLVMLLVGALVAAYEKSENFRNVIAGLGAALKELVVTHVQGMITGLKGLVDVLMGVLTLDADRIKKGFSEQWAGLKGMFWGAGQNAAKAYGEGYNAEAARQDHEANKQYEERRKEFAQRIKDALAKRVKQEAEEAKKGRLEALKNEEADLKERLAKVKEGSEAEMRLKQKIVTNAAAQELLDEKKTAADRRIILAEAEGKRVQLAQEFYEKQAKEQAAAALKRRLAAIEAEKLHQEMLIQLRQAAVAARGDELVTENAKIYAEGELKIVALRATAKKEIAQLLGTAAQKKALTLDLEKKLGADIALVRADVAKKQGEAIDKDNAEEYKKTQEAVEQEVEAIEQGAERQQEAMLVPFHASLKLQQELEEKKYQIRQEAFERELDLMEKKLGKESAEYKKAQVAQQKDIKAHLNWKTAEEERAFKAKQDLQRLEMQTASDVLSFAVQLLDQDGEARKKHHSLYTALAAAKIIVDGTKEVQQIWEYSAENPYNGGTMGAAGIAMGTIQTALAVARTTIALSKLGGGGNSDSGDNTSYAKGGATGTGLGLAASPLGLLMQASGMQVDAGGRLTDGSGFAVAGVVHEDEYVIPKWQLQDPQVAAVAQWLEARRLRGFDGGGHTSASSGAALPVAAASPSTDGEKLYAVQAQMLDALVVMTQQLGDVKGWQDRLQVHLNLRDAQARTDEYKQVQYNSAIRSKSAAGG